MSICNSVFSLNEHPGKGWSRKPEGTWICRYCNKDCGTYRKLLEHYKNHPEYKQVSKNNKTKWNCEYCKETFKTRRLLYSHYKTCEEKDKLPKDVLGRVIKKEKFIKQGQTYHNNYVEGKIISWNLGKKNTPEHNAHIAEGTNRYLKEHGELYGARYSNKGCEYIEQLNKKNNWHLQHAKNGGEITVGPYYLDGYDKELNIAFEYDEPRHYIDIENNILTERDMNRMQYIKDHLHCKFYRYNEKLDLFYEV